MPIYEYACQICETKFEATVPVEKRDEVDCPNCHGLSIDVARQTSAPAAFTGNGLTPRFFATPPSKKSVTKEDK